MGWGRRSVASRRVHPHRQTGDHQQTGPNPIAGQMLGPPEPALAGLTEADDCHCVALEDARVRGAIVDKHHRVVASADSDVSPREQE